MNASDTNKNAVASVVPGGGKTALADLIKNSGPGLVITGNLFRFRGKRNPGAQDRRNGRRALRKAVAAWDKYRQDNPRILIVCDEPHRLGKRGGK